MSIASWSFAFASWSALFVLTGDGIALFIALASGWLAGQEIIEKRKGSER